MMFGYVPAQGTRADRKVVFLFCPGSLCYVCQLFE